MNANLAGNRNESAELFEERVIMQMAAALRVTETFNNNSNKLREQQKRGQINRQTDRQRVIFGLTLRKVSLQEK